jgi:triacylglycerol esterase/lipase EstA (alpha/beta hydrolase family)
MGDIQIAAEYVVFGIRTLHARTAQQVSLVGHSQGGMIGRWALKYWPDTRRMVDDVVGMAPSSHGTQVAEWMCNPDCAPAIWQQRADSAFMAALNDGPETWPGISYTVVYSRTDGIIVPAESSRLTTGAGRIANIAIGEACPGRTVDHLGLGTYDPVTHALVVDALDHPGPASLSRFDTGACTKTFQPGVNQTFFAFHYGRTVSAVGATILLTPHVPAEPEPAAYVR